MRKKSHRINVAIWLFGYQASLSFEKKNCILISVTENTLADATILFSFFFCSNKNDYNEWNDSWVMSIRSDVGFAKVAFQNGRGGATNMKLPVHFYWAFEHRQLIMRIAFNFAWRDKSGDVAGSQASKDPAFFIMAWRKSLCKLGFRIGRRPWPGRR